MPFGQPDDQEIPDYHPFLMNAAGMAPGATQDPALQAAAPPQVAPQTAAAVPQAQATQTATPAGTQPQSPAILLPPNASQGADPQAPQAPQFDATKYEAALSQRKTDAAPQIVSPKWYDRLAGAAVGFGAGYNGDVAGGIRAGSAVTNRRQTDADFEQGKKLAADDAGIAEMKNKYDLDSKVYENNLKGFGAQREVARDNQQQSNFNQTFNQNATIDKRNYERQVGRDARSDQNDTRDFGEKQHEFQTNSGRMDRETNEQIRHNRSVEGTERARTGLEGQRVKIEQQKADQDGEDIKLNGRRGGKAPNDTVTPEQWQNLIKERTKAYDDAQKQRDLEAANLPGKTPEAKQQAQQALNAKYDGLAKSLQNEWNQRLSTADPTGRYAQQQQPQQPQPSQGVAAPQQQAAAAPPQAPPTPQKTQAAPASVQVQQKQTTETAYAPLPPDKVRVRMPDGSIKVGPRSALAEAAKHGAVEVK